MPRLTDVILGDGSRQTFEVPDHYTPEEEAATVKGMGATRDWLVPIRRKIIDTLASSQVPGVRKGLDIVLPSSEEEIAAMVATGAFGGLLGTAGRAITAPGSIAQKVAPTMLRTGLVAMVGGTTAYLRGVENYKERAAVLAAGNIFGETVVGAGSAFFKNVGARVPQKISNEWAKTFGEALDPIFPNAKTAQDIGRLFHAGESKELIRKTLDDFDTQIFSRLSPDKTLQLPVLPEVNALIPKAQRIPVIKGPQGEDLGITSFGDAFKGLRVLRAVRQDLMDAGKGAKAGQLLDTIKIFEEQLNRSVQQAAPEAAALMAARLKRASKMYAIDDVMKAVPGLIESSPSGPIFRMEKLYDAFTWRQSPSGPSLLERLSKVGLDDFVEALYPRGTGPGFGVSRLELGAPFIRGRTGGASIGERVPVGTSITTFPGGPPGPKAPLRTGGVAGMRGEEAVREQGLIPGMTQ